MRHIHLTLVAVMSELIFEGYHAPSVTYSIDSLASFYNTGRQDGIVISSGTANTHVIPVINGRGILAHAKRCILISFFPSIFGIRLARQAKFTNVHRFAWGSTMAADYLLKLVQLKFPSFPTRVSPHQASVRPLLLRQSSALVFCTVWTDQPNRLYYASIVICRSTMRPRFAPFPILSRSWRWTGLSSFPTKSRSAISFCLCVLEIEAI
jgi:Actin